MSNRKFLPFIFPLFVISLLAGIWAGWLRIGWNFPITEIAGEHGALMVGSFLGTLVSLERTVIIKSKWTMLVPFLSGISLPFFLLGMTSQAFVALALGSLGQAIIMGYFYLKYNEFYLAVIFSGSICWFVGNVLMIIKGLYPMAVPWWMAFLLLVIIGERLELSKYLPIRKFKKHLLLAALILFVVGIILPFHGDGRHFAASGLIFTGIWLLKYDMANKAIKKSGLHRYSGIMLLMGYVWLIISGILLIIGDAYPFIYDAVLHSFFLGFVFSMIFAHGPIILPGVIGIPLKPYHWLLYIPGVILQISLITRIFADVSLLVILRKWAGMWNGIAILLFFVMMLFLMVKGRKELGRELKL